MSTQAVQPLFSTPVYQQQPEALPAVRRVLVSQTFDHPDSTALRASLQALDAPLQVLVLADQDASALGCECCADQKRLQQALLAQLQATAVGTRLYLCGDEAFIWQCRALARQAGMLDEEIEQFRLGSRRALYCVHCATQQEITDADQVDCAGCGVRLQVRAHFSRRLGAYMGVCLNPNQPRGESRP